MSEQTQKKSGAPQRPAPAGFGPMGRGAAMMQGGEKPKNFRDTMKRLMQYLRAYRLSLIVVLVFAMASTIFAIASPKILGHMTNSIVDDFVNRKAYDAITAQLPAGTVLPEGTTGGQFISRLPAETLAHIPDSVQKSIATLDITHKPEFHYDFLRTLALELLGLYIISALFNYIQGWVMTRISQEVSYKMRRELSEKVNRLPLKYFDSHTHGEVLSRFSNDVDTVSQTLNQSMSQMVSSATMLIGILVMMLTISWQLTLVALFIIPMSFMMIALVAKRSQKYFAQQQKTLGQMNGHIEEMYSGHTVMRVFNGQKRSIETFNAFNKDMHTSGWKSQFLSGLLFPLMAFMSNLSFVGVSVVGGWLAVNGRISIGDIQAFIQYVQQFNQPIMQTASIANVLQSTAAAAERVFEFLDEPEEMTETQMVHVEPATMKGTVEFVNVHFGYSPEKTIINDFSAVVHPGQRVAIVGPTGAGKTTMVNLLMRFYDTQSGSILIDGVDTKSMSRQDVRTLFGMVLQDTWLFNGTIRDNIAYGNPDATEEEIIEAAKAAHVDHFVRALPGGYDMVLNEETNNISQGEKQLLTIARAMLVKTPMLILDEATSSVDTRTEVLIQQAMERLMHKKTSFVIAHRLSTIRTADLILVMKDGNIIEQGTHDTLLAQNGFYASMYNSQFAGAIAA